MSGFFLIPRLINGLFILGFVASIAACGGGGGGGGASNSTPTSSSSVNSSSISSSVKSSSKSSTSKSAVNDGIGAAAKFYNPAYVVRVGDNLYVTEEINQTIRKVVIATGEVTTLAGTAGIRGSADGIGAAARFDTPNGITSDGANLYVADSANHTIRKIVIATGKVTTLAGTAGLSNGTDGTGAEAGFFFPNGITNDGTNLYVTSNQTIRKIVMSTGVVTTFAGAYFMPDSSDGVGTEARFSDPIDITTDGTNLFVVDRFTSKIRKIVIATREVTTFVGVDVDGVERLAGFNNPSGITSDGVNLYVSDTNSKIVRKITIATNAVKTLAGMASVSGSTDGIGTAASFDMPFGVTTDGTNLYVADIFNNTIRKIVIATGEVTTLVGTAGVRGVVSNER